MITDGADDDERDTNEDDNNEECLTGCYGSAIVVWYYARCIVEW